VRPWATSGDTCSFSARAFAPAVDSACASLPEAAASERDLTGTRSSKTPQKPDDPWRIARARRAFGDPVVERLHSEPRWTPTKRTK
jgi:hypothetical protein